MLGGRAGILRAYLSVRRRKKEKKEKKKKKREAAYVCEEERLLRVGVGKRQKKKKNVTRKREREEERKKRILMTPHVSVGLLGDLQEGVGSLSPDEGSSPANSGGNAGNAAAGKHSNGMDAGNGHHHHHVGDTNALNGVVAALGDEDESSLLLGLDDLDAFAVGGSMRGAGGSHHNHVMEASLSMHYAHQSHENHASAGAAVVVVDGQNAVNAAAAADVEVSHATPIAVHHPNAANEAAARAANALRNFGQRPHQHQIVQLHSRSNGAGSIQQHDDYQQQQQQQQHHHRSLMSSAATVMSGSGRDGAPLESIQASSRQHHGQHMGHGNGRDGHIAGLSKQEHVHVQQSSIFGKSQQMHGDDAHTMSYAHTSSGGMTKCMSTPNLQVFSQNQLGVRESGRPLQQQYAQHHGSHQQHPSVEASVSARTMYEARQAQLARYRAKRAARLRAAQSGHKKIRYECRKTLADNRPRVKGRFAKVHGPNGVLNGQLSTKVDAPRPVAAVTVTKMKTNGSGNAETRGNGVGAAPKKENGHRTNGKAATNGNGRGMAAIFEEGEAMEKAHDRSNGGVHGSSCNGDLLAQLHDEGDNGAEQIVPQTPPTWGVLGDDDILIDTTTSFLNGGGAGGNSEGMKRSFSDTALFASDPVAFA